MRTELLALGLAAVFVALPAAAADSAAKSLKALDKQMGGVTKKVDQTLAQMDKTMSSMDQVRRAEPSALGKRVPSFRKEVDQLTKDLEDVRSEFVDMRGKGAEYFKRWEASNATISDPALRNTAMERRNTAVQKHEKLTDEVVAYRDTITQYMSGLTDLSKVLSADPSAAKSPAVLEKMEALKAQYPSVRSGLQAGRDQITKFREGMPTS